MAAYCMEQGSGLVEFVVDASEAHEAAPTLLVTLPPWRQVFLQNLRDLWARRQPPLRLASKPGDFWPDVFVASRLPWRSFLESSVSHCVLIAAIWGATQYWPHRAQIAERPAFNRSDVIYFDASEYLPPLDTGGAHAQLPKKGEPAYAPQPIFSVPPEADNRSQTIVAPPNVKLDRDVPMPNVVAWSPTPVAVPIAATARSMADSRALDLTVSVVAPAPDLRAASSERTRRTLQSEVIEPPPNVNAASMRRLGDINIGHSEAVAPAPKLPVAEQLTLAATRARLDSSGAAVVPPPPSVQGSRTSRGDGRLIALGIHPIAAGGPVQPPAGNRRGSFAATPQGKPGAPGTPDVAASGNHSAESGAGSGHGNSNGAGSGKSSDVPPGLFVGSGPNSANHSAIGGNGQGGGSGAGTALPQSAKNQVLMADATPPRVSVPRHPESSNPRESEADKEIFGDRKFYSMSINMPNLNSAGGSWVIHFAEMKLNGGGDRKNDDKEQLSTPTAIAIASPGYPLELMRHNVQGVVILYAVIHSDGSVGDVKVLRSIDDQLDEYARAALARWRFRPATKNGSPVDLEAVVTIPFKPSRLKSSF
jgi:TonB family protein